MPIDFVRTMRSDEQTVRFGEDLGRLLRAGDTLALDGPLGAGKTTLVRGIAAGMGIAPGIVSSPTFVVINEYTADAGAPDLIHVDAYRLSGADDLDSLGWDRLMEPGPSGGAPRPRGVLVVEWADRIADALPADAARIRLEPIDQDVRELHVTVPSAWASRPGLGPLTGRPPTRCRITGEPVPPESPTYPFANERARMADLHKWFSGAYGITRPIEEADLEEG